MNFPQLLLVAAQGGLKNNVTTYVSDAFDRADSAVSLGSADVGGAWTATTGTWGIGTNAARLVTDAGQDVAQINSTVADCTIRCTFSVVGANSQRVVFRFSDASNFVMCQTEGTTYKVYKYVATVFTQLGTFTATPANGDAIMVILSGNNIDFYLNGTLRISASDAFNNTATRHGLGGANNTGASTRWEDFSVKSA